MSTDATTLDRDLATGPEHSAEAAPLPPCSPSPFDIRLAVKIHVAMLLLAAVVIGASVLMRVEGQQQVTLPGLAGPLPGLCTFRRVLGIDCPGCGLTRCFISLGHGELLRAWRFNPAGILFFAVVVFQVPYRVIQLWRIRRGLREIDLGRAANWTLLFVALCMIGQWVLRTVGLF